VKKLLKFAAPVAKLAGGVALGVVIALLLLPVKTTPESRAAFKAWEATQTRQEGRGAAQTGKDGQRAVGVPKSLHEEDLAVAREEFFHAQVFETSYRSRDARNQAGEPMFGSFLSIPGFDRSCDKASLHAWLFAMTDGVPPDTPANACVRSNLHFMVASWEFCEASDPATRPDWCSDIGFRRSGASK
jgi:hypothetical protein